MNNGGFLSFILKIKRILILIGLVLVIFIKVDDYFESIEIPCTQEQFHEILLNQPVHVVAYTVIEATDEYDMLKFSIANDTESMVSDFIIGYVLYDENNEIIKLQGNKVNKLFYEDVKIKANMTGGEEQTVYLPKNLKVNRVEAMVYRYSSQENGSATNLFKTEFEELFSENDLNADAKVKLKQSDVDTIPNTKTEMVVNQQLIAANYATLYEDMKYSYDLEMISEINEQHELVMNFVNNYTDDDFVVESYNFILTAYDQNDNLVVMKDLDSLDDYLYAVTVDDDGQESINFGQIDPKIKRIEAIVYCVVADGEEYYNPFFIGFYDLYKNY